MVTADLLLTGPHPRTGRHSNQIKFGSIQIKFILCRRAPPAASKNDVGSLPLHAQPHTHKSLVSTSRLIDSVSAHSRKPSCRASGDWMIGNGGQEGRCRLAAAHSFPNTITYQHLNILIDHTQGTSTFLSISDPTRFLHAVANHQVNALGVKLLEEPLAANKDTILLGFRV